MSTVNNRVRTCLVAFAWGVTCLIGLGSSTSWGLEEEFVGPFPSWLDARRDFGAVGDGRADDTVALQAALDVLREHQRACVLFLPAGIYRLTNTLHTSRKNHTDNMVTIVGEDPEKVILLWDGPQDGTMLQWDAWYAKISRITFDGRARAGTCLFYGPSFSTYNETSDLVFRNAKQGIVFGSPDSAGQAENEVLRCRFYGCDTAIQTVNWNSMDIWVWYCHFEDCGRGIHNVMGNWHAWHNRFIRSRISDVSIANLMVFSVVNNTSVGSRCFLDFSTGHTWGAPTSITGNRVLDPTGDWAMVLDNAGPYLIVDNEFRLGPTTRAIRMTWGDQTLLGNRYSRADVVEERGRFRRVHEETLLPQEFSTAIPDLPPTPPRRERPVIDLPPTADAAMIQDAINKAASMQGQRPVVHLPMGAYHIDRTLVIPPDCDLQLIGDGASEVATRLIWAGPPDGSLIKVQGASQVTLRDLHLRGGSVPALILEVPDDERVRVFADQLNANGPSQKSQGIGAAVRIERFANAAIQFRALQGSGQSGRWVQVFGPGDKTGTPVTIFTGATGSAVGQYEVRDNGCLIVRSIYHEKSSDALCGLHLADSGTLHIDATRFSYATSETAPTVLLEDFRGLCTVATCLFLPVETQETCRIEIRGDGSKSSVLALNNQFWVVKPGTSADTIWLNRAQPPAAGGLLGCNVNTSNKEVSARGFEFLRNLPENPDPARSSYGSSPLDNRGGVDDSTVLRHLESMRKVRPWIPSPNSSGDIMLQRVIATSEAGTTVIVRASDGL